MMKILLISKNTNSNSRKETISATCLTKSGNASKEVAPRALSKGKFSLLPSFFLILISLFGIGSAWGQTTATYSTPGTYTWICPAGVTSITVQAWGGGGAGGGINNSAVKRAGSGGGGGAFATKVVSVTPGTSYTIVVGAGGTGVSAANGNNGASSTFGGTTVVAVGGSGGLAHTAAASTAMTGASGGLASSCTPTIGAYSGGNGGNSTTVPVSGAGGGSAGTSGNGGNATTSTAGAAGASGGGAGAAGKSTSAAGGAGSAPGGGGSGAAQVNTTTTARAGGAGGAGKVIITYTDSYCAITGTPSATYYISNVSTSGGVTNISNASTTTSTQLNGYFNSKVSQYQGSTVTLSPTIASIASAHDFAVYIDWNADGDFIDSGEELYTTGAQISSNPTITITVPATASVGMKRMRLWQDYNSVTPAPCTNPGAGEVEDYNFEVLQAPPTITTSGTLSAFSACSGVASTEQSFTVSGTNLTADIVVTPPTGFEISITSGSGFGTSAINLAPSSGTVTSKTIYVRMAALASNPTTANISCTSTGATTKNVSASGTVVPNLTASSITPSTTQNLCTGASGSALSLSNTGGGTLTYSWGKRSTSGGAITALGVTTATYTPTATSLGNGTWYVVCTTTPTCGTAIVTNEVTVNVANVPAISVQPSATASTCTGGSSGNLSLTATGGAPSLTYQWQYSTTSGGSYTNVANGTPAGSTYSNATSNTNFSVSGISSAGTYYYKCVVSATGTGCTAVTSNAVALTVSSSVGGTASAANNTVCVNTSATLNLTGQTGTIQWEESANGSTGWAAIVGATNSTTTSCTTAPLTSGTKYYRAAVTNGSCAVAYSNTVTITVGAATTPTVSITDSDADDKICNGTSVTFTATAANLNGTSVSNYNWYVGGLSVQSNATNTYTSTTLTHGQDVYCVITTTAGCVSTTTATSNSITMSVLSHGALRENPLGAQCTGTQLNFSATPTGGNGTYSYAWSTTPLAGGSMSPTTGSASTFSTTPTNTTGAQGTYSIVVNVTSDGLTCSNTFGPTVKSIPTVTTGPSNASVGSGSNTSFTVVGTSGSSTAATYSWEVSTNGGSTWTAITDGGVYSTSSTATLNISGVTGTMNNYRYRAYVIGECGTSSASSSATLTVSYCNSNATSAADDEILNVTLGTLNNSSTCSTTGGTGSTLNQYSNYTATVSAPSLQKGSTVSGSVIIGYCSGTAYATSFAVFIDYNQDMDFNDANETVYSNLNITAAVAGTAYPFSITIPSTALLGTTRMRVVDIEQTTIPSSCGTYTWGETEDYIVNITAQAASTVSSYSASVCAGGNITITGTNFATASAVKIGGVDMASFTVNSNTQISATLPANATTNTITVTNEGGTGTGPSYTVLTTPLPPNVSAASTTLNVGGSATITATAQGSGTLNWWNAATGGTMVISNNNTWSTGVLCAAGNTTTYYVEETNGSCGSVRTAAAVTTRSLIAANPSNGIICSTGGTVELTANTTNGTAFSWSGVSFSGSSTSSIVTANPTATATYTLAPTVTGCASITGTNTFNVGVIEGVTITPTATPSSLCQGATSVLASGLTSSGFTVTSITNAPSAALSPSYLMNGGTTPVVAFASGNTDDGGWSGIPIGFNYNFFGSTYTTVNVGTNGVIQFGSYNSNGGSTSPYGLGDYTFTNSFPTTLEPMNIIAGGACDLTVSGGTVRYWTQGISPTRIFIIEYIVNGLSSGTNNFQIKLFETTGNVEIHVTSNTAQTGSNKVIGINNSTGTTGNTAYSNSANLTNTAWKFVPGVTYTYQWSASGAAIGGATSTNYTTSALNTAGDITYTVAATNPNTQCASTGTVVVTVNAKPAAPTGTNVTSCSAAGAQTLTATPPSGSTVNWYANNVTNTALATNSNTYQPASVSTATYYAESQSAEGCKSATRTGITLTVNATPSVPTGTSAYNYCVGESATQLTATASSGNTLNWYTVATNGTPLASAPTPSTSTAGSTNYYVSQTNGTSGCESNRLTVTVNVNAAPSAPTVTTPVTYCQNETASQLSATLGLNCTANWYTVPTGGSASGTAPTPTTSSAGTTSYYVSQTQYGCEGVRATIDVVVNPTLVASVSNSASSTSACGGGSITFTATPTNGGTPTYQWYLNGNTVGTNSTTYTLASPANNDQIYVAMTPSAQSCLQSAATTNSNTVTLTSSASTPSVSIQSTASSAVCPGTSVTFSVNSSANMGATPSYQWKLNGTNISGATSSTYATTSLVNNDQVSLEMTSSLNGLCVTQQSATSSAITTSVNTATSITTQPTATSGCTGTTANFSVVGAGQGTLTYQWKKNGTNITGNATALTNSLTLTGIGASDATTYTVDVTGSCGTVSSSSAALTISPSTSITTNPSATTKCAGLQADFSVVATGGGTLTYQWRKAGVNISGATSSTYSIPSVVSNDGANYSVVVTGLCGNATSSNALLTVNPGTSITTHPSSSTICANANTTLSVVATGSGSLSYQWKKDGVNTGTNSSSLALNSVTSGSAGSYTVDVTSSVCSGTATSNAAVLTVNPATQITSQPSSNAGCEGQNTTFSVGVTGTSPYTYQWKFNGTNISGATSSTYNISSTTISNDGNYSVQVSGTCGSALSSSVALSVYPSPTTTATISTADVTDATLCGKNQVSVAANTPGAESTGEWSVVGSWGIVPESNTTPSTTFTANNAALGGTPKKLVWSHIRNTSGNLCYTRDTITVDFKQPIISSISGVIQNGDVVWGGLSNTSWSTSDNWYQYQVVSGTGALIRMTQGEPTSTTKVYTLSNATAGACVSSSNIPALGSGEAAANVYVGTGATLNLSSGTLTIAGDFTNNGTINPGTGTVTFNGSAAQKITGTGTVANLNNVIVNKSGGTLTLEQPTKVAGTLTMTQGDIITDATNILEVGTSATSVGSVSWAAGTVRGPMKRWFAASTNSTQASGVFPVGATIPGKGVINRYAQVNFSSAPGTGGYIVAEYKSGMPGNNYSGLPLNYSSGSYPQAIQNAEEEGYWDITPYSAGNVAYAALNSTPYTLKVRLQNPSTLTNGWTTNNDGNDLYNAATIRLIRSKGSTGHASWELAGNHVSATEAGNGDYFITSSGITEFSWFNGGGNNQNPLPVELVSFTGACDEGIINLTWQTASEFNSSHFDVEKSRDGENWQVLTTLPSAGTSNELITYQSTDQNGTEGNNYFRLRQVDIDGTEKLYDPINVSCSEVTTGYFSSFPNPSGTAFQVVVNNKELIGTCTLNMVDASGKVIEQRTIDVKEGINLFVINQDLNPGIYFLNITNGAKSTPIVRHAIK